MQRRIKPAIVILLAGTLASSCGDDARECVTNSDCPAPTLCLGGTCRGGDDAGLDVGRDLADGESDVSPDLPEDPAVDADVDRADVPDTPDGNEDARDEEACSPSAEACNNLDDDCDGTIDNGCDDDEDGFCDADLTYDDADVCPQGPGDCNDDDRLINPAADEVCDGVDNDCDDTIDNDTALDATVWFRDMDGDEYGVDGTTRSACERPDDYAAVAGDCNDGDMLVNPGADEVCRDHTDNDCDDTEVCALVGDVPAGTFGGNFNILPPLADPARAVGVSLAACDVIGDESLDLIIGAPDTGRDGAIGKVLIVPGPLTYSEGSAVMFYDQIDGLVELEGAIDARFGAAVACGDVSGDGNADVVVGEPDGGVGGRVHIFRGPVTTGDPDSSITTMHAGAELGASVAIASLTTDATLDIAAGAPGHGSGTGRLWWFPGPIGLTDIDADGVASWLSGSLDAAWGRTLAYRDVTMSDGSRRLLVGGGGIDGDLLGAVPTDADAPEQSPSWFFGLTGPDATAGIAIDLDTSGVADLVVAVPYAPRTGNPTSGRLFLLPDVAGDVTLDVGNELAPSSRIDDELRGISLHAGDVNGDGNDDLVAGVGFADDSFGAYLFYGGQTVATDPDAVVLAGSGGGQTTVLVADLDSDGYADLIFGRVSLTADNGSVAIVFGRGQ